MAQALAAGAARLSNGMRAAPRAATARSEKLPAQYNGGRANSHRDGWRAWLGAYSRPVLAYSSCRSCALLPGGGPNRTSALRGRRPKTCLSSAATAW
jgi:hypothetical protein